MEVNMIVTCKSIRVPGKLLCLLLIAAVCFSSCKPKPEEKPAEQPDAPATEVTQPDASAAEATQPEAETPGAVVAEMVEKVFPLSFENYNWTGKGLLDGEEITVTIIDRSGEGKPLDFSRRAYIAISKGDQPRRSIGYSQLSKIICIDNLFYTVSIDDNVLKFEEYTGPKGTIEVTYDSPGIVSADVTSGYFAGKDEKGIMFNIAGSKDKKLELPAMEYTASTIVLKMKDSEGVDWQAWVMPGQNTPITVETGKPAVLALTAPGLAVTAVDETKRRNPPKTQQTEYAKGAKIFFNAEMSNDTGQKYYRINKGNKGITPEFKILDPAGTEIASKTMEYG
jgi:hypothetical protein